jgi:hypothetical protein
MLLQIGGLLIQGATFDGARLGPLAQVGGQFCALWASSHPHSHTFVARAFVGNEWVAWNGQEVAVQNTAGEHLCVLTRV